MGFGLAVGNSMIRYSQADRQGGFYQANIQGGTTEDPASIGQRIGMDISRRHRGRRMPYQQAMQEITIEIDKSGLKNGRDQARAFSAARSMLDQNGQIEYRNP